MQKLKIIEWVRKNMGLSKAEISRLAGRSPGLISKLDTRGKALTETNLERVVDALQIEITNTDFKFKDGSFLKIKIGQNFLGGPDYSGLYRVLEKFRGKNIRVFVVTAIPETTHDELDRAFQEKVLPEVPANFLIIDIENGNHLIYARRSGYRTYLTYLKELKENLLGFGCNITDVKDRDIKFNEVDRDFVVAFLKRHSEDRRDSSHQSANNS